RTALAIKDEPDAVTVKWFHDEALAQLGDGVSEAGAAPGGEVMAMVRMYGGKAGLGVLAGFSLLMMLMMVRKVSEGPVLPGEEPPKPIYRVIGKRRQTPTEEEEGDEFMLNAPPIGKAEAHEQL